MAYIIQKRKLNFQMRFELNTLYFIEHQILIINTRKNLNRNYNNIL